ncbi:MAG: hypothetical protein ACXVLQ_06800 [Bacteriovorax sp.]
MKILPRSSALKFSLLFLILAAHSGQSATPLVRPKETLKIGPDSFYDTKVDYSKFSGRVTDRDATASIVKISSENKNVKFFRAGDLVEFKVQNSKESDFCQGHVRSIEESYFVMFVKDLFPCFPKEEFFRRGTALIMQSEKLEMRVREASVYRASLLNKKKDFMGQLNNINQDVWNFEERKIQVAAEFDQKIAEIEKQKTRALDQLLDQKNDQIRLQRELAYRLDNIDKELNFYRIEKEELLFDRWHLDHDLGYPVYEKPEEIRPRRASGESTVD